MKILKIIVYVMAVIAFFLIFNSLSMVVYDSEHMRHHLVLSKIFMVGVIITSCVLNPLFAYYWYTKDSLKSSDASDSSDLSESLEESESSEEL